MYSSMNFSCMQTDPSKLAMMPCLYFSSARVPDARRIWREARNFCVSLRINDFNKENITEQRRVDDLTEGNTLMGRIILPEFCCAGSFFIGWRTNYNRKDSKFLEICNNSCYTIGDVYSQANYCRPRFANFPQKSNDIENIDVKGTEKMRKGSSVSVMCLTTLYFRVRRISTFRRSYVNWVSPVCCGCFLGEVSWGDGWN